MTSLGRFGRWCLRNGFRQSLQILSFGVRPQPYRIYRYKAEGRRPYPFVTDGSFDVQRLRELRAAQPGCVAEFFRDESHPDWIPFFCEDAGRLSGILWVRRNTDPAVIRLRESEVELTGAYVMPEARGRGVAKQLISAACSWAESHTCTAVYATIHNDNLSSQRAFEAAGFIKTAETVRPALFGPLFLCAEGRFESWTEMLRRFVGFGH